VRTARRYRTVQIRAGQQLLTAEDPLPDDLREALAPHRPDPRRPAGQSASSCAPPAGVFGGEQLPNVAINGLGRIGPAALKSCWTPTGSTSSRSTTTSGTRPIDHHKRESIEAHLTIVFAALAVSRLIEDRTG
jgi:hypothetical protein